MTRKTYRKSLSNLTQMVDCYLFSLSGWYIMDVEVAFPGRNDFQKQIPSLSGGNYKCMHYIVPTISFQESASKHFEDNAYFQFVAPNRDHHVWNETRITGPRDWHLLISMDPIVPGLKVSCLVGLGEYTP